MKFSGPPASTRLTLDDVQRSVDLTRQQFVDCEYTIGTTSVDPSDVVFIFAAYRNVQQKTDDKKTDVLWPANALVLDRDDLQRLYGPSLYHRPQFVVDYLSSCY